MKKILCLDFDGVIHSYTSGWKGPRVIPDPPVPGALEFIAKATVHFQVMIYSSRSGYWFGRLAMKRWLFGQFVQIGDPKADDTTIQEWYWKLLLDKTGMDPWKYEVHYGVERLLKKIKFPRKKPPAFIGLDDRVKEFTGIFPNVEELKEFKPWNKKSV